MCVGLFAHVSLSAGRMLVRIGNSLLTKDSGMLELTWVLGK